MKIKMYLSCDYEEVIRIHHIKQRCNMLDAYDGIILPLTKMQVNKLGMKIGQQKVIHIELETKNKKKYVHVR